MELVGRIRQGVVVLEGNISLPEGMRVLVYPHDEQAAKIASAKVNRVALPLVHSASPGTLNLTRQMMVEALEDDDAVLG